MDIPKFTDNQTYQWTSLGLHALRHTMNDMSFHEILPAILSQEIEPGSIHSVVVLGNQERPHIDHFEKENDQMKLSVSRKEAYYLAVSQTFEKQQAAEHLSRTYCLAPCTRLLKNNEKNSGKTFEFFFSNRNRMAY